MDAGRDYGAVIVSCADPAIDPDVLRRGAPWQDATHLMLQNEIPEALNLAVAQAARAGHPRGPDRRPRARSVRYTGRGGRYIVVNAGEAEPLFGQRVASLDKAEAAARTSARRFRPWWWPQAGVAWGSWGRIWPMPSRGTPSCWSARKGSDAASSARWRPMPSQGTHSTKAVACADLAAARQVLQLG